jgi:hypothetical protein
MYLANHTASRETAGQQVRRPHLHEYVVARTIGDSRRSHEDRKLDKQGKSYRMVDENGTVVAGDWSNPEGGASRSFGGRQRVSRRPVSHKCLTNRPFQPRNRRSGPMNFLFNEPMRGATLAVAEPVEANPSSGLSAPLDGASCMPVQGPVATQALTTAAGSSW